MALFARGFSDYFNNKQHSDVALRIHLEPSSRKGASAKTEISAHRLILGYHSPFFYENFKQVVSRISQKELQDQPSESAVSPRKIVPESPTKKKSSSSSSRVKLGVIPSVSFHLDEESERRVVVDIDCGDERVYSFVKPFFEFIYGSKADVTEVR